VVLKLGDEFPGDGGELVGGQGLLPGCRPRQGFSGGPQPGVVAGQPCGGLGEAFGKQERLLLRCLAQYLGAGVAGQRRQFGTGPLTAGGCGQQVLGACRDLAQQQRVLIGQRQRWPSGGSADSGCSYPAVRLIAVMTALLTSVFTNTIVTNIAQLVHRASERGLTWTSTTLARRGRGRGAAI
jgi:hypothetical protein